MRIIAQDHSLNLLLYHHRHIKFDANVNVDTSSNVTCEQDFYHIVISIKYHFSELNDLTVICTFPC